MRVGVRLALIAASLVTIVFALMSHPPELLGGESDPTKHVLGLFVLTILAVRSFPGVRLITIMLWLAGSSALLEYLQGVPPFHRDPDPYDWLAGMTGVLIALGAIALLRMIARPKSGELQTLIRETVSADAPDRANAADVTDAADAVNAADVTNVMDAADSANTADAVAARH